MAKRFTDSRKWRDPFFRKLPTHLKLFWIYLLDECNHAGMWKVDFEMASFCIGIEIAEQEAVSAFNGRIKVIDSETWFVPKFIDFQYGKLSEDSKPHKSVIDELKKERVYKGYAKGIDTLKDKDKEKVMDKDKDKDKALPIKVKDFVDRWNELNPIKAKHISQERKEKFRARCQENAFVDNWQLIIKKASESDFLTGRKPSKSHPNFKGDIDWVLCNGNNYVKVLEGKYDSEKYDPLKRYEV